MDVRRRSSRLMLLMTAGAVSAWRRLDGRRLRESRERPSEGDRSAAAGGGEWLLRAVRGRGVRGRRTKTSLGQSLGENALHL